MKTTMKSKAGALVWGNLIVILIAANWLILAKERHIQDGRRVLLEIAKYDPRSLMQGDYMALNYPIAREIGAKLGVTPGDTVRRESEGLVVLAVDADDVGRLERVHAGEPLAEDESLLYYRLRWGRSTVVRVAAEQFFFQEGLAEEFERARFAELRIDSDGRTLLVALCDSERRRIGQDPR